MSICVIYLPNEILIEHKNEYCSEIANGLFFQMKEKMDLYSMCVFSFSIKAIHDLYIVNEDYKITHITRENYNALIKYMVMYDINPTHILLHNLGLSD
jgi:hypothetical protein